MFNKFVKHVKEHWFPYILVGACYFMFSVFGNFGSEIMSKKCQVESDRPNCYIFYGLAQNSIGIDGNKDRLEVRYLIEGFPKRPHGVFIEVLDHHGQLDFLYSEEHTSSHKAHYCKKGCSRQYKAFYKIPKSLKSGQYKSSRT